MIRAQLITLMIVFAIGILLGVVGGWDYTRQHYQTEISGMNATQAKTIAATESAARQRLQSAQEWGDILSARLSKTEDDLNQKSKELSREIARLTTGRRCLDGNVVRLLNRPASSAGSVSETTRTPVAQDGAAATDTDVAGWIGNARTQYDTCRARLGDLIDFDTK